MDEISKDKILKMLSSSLEFFYPELRKQFLCPTCLTSIPLHKKGNITEAHIIPRKAQGKLRTYLCKDCNSLFGRKQDKWFGELVRLNTEEATSIFATDIRDGHFWIDNIRVNGDWEQKQNGTLSFYIHKDRNSPGINALMQDKFGMRPPTISLSLSFPVLKHERMIEIGFLTAAYLMWFRALGYSWVLQSHLNTIREQIMNPEKDILKTRFVAYCNKIKWRPWIGLVTISDEIALAMGLENTLVLFPPMDRPELYSKLENDFTGKVGKDIRPLQFWRKPYYGEPVCLAFDNRMLVAPDAAMDEGLPSLIIQFVSGSVEAQLLRPVSKEEFKQKAKTPGSTEIHIDTTHVKRDSKISIKK
jgi:hypothetical protein